MSRSLHGNGVKKNKYECFLIKYSTVLVCTVCLRIQQRINCQNTLKQSKSMYFMKPLLHENGFFSPCQGVVELSGLPGYREPSFRDYTVFQKVELIDLCNERLICVIIKFLLRGLQQLRVSISKYIKKSYFHFVISK